MWPHFVNLLARSWQSVLGSLSTSTLSIVLFSLATPILIFVITVIIAHKRNPGSRFIVHARESIRPTIVGLAVPFVLIAIVFVFEILVTVFADHQALVAAIHKLQTTPKPVCPVCPAYPAKSSQQITGRSRKREIQSRLAELLNDGIAIRNGWLGAMGRPEEEQRLHSNQVRQWHSKIEAYLGTIPRGSTYLAKLNSGIRTDLGYPAGLNMNVGGYWDLLVTDLATLNNFINDPDLGNP